MNTRGFTLLLLITALALPTSASGAQEPHRLKIVDTFSEGVSSGSEISAIPDEEAQKAIANQPNNAQRLRVLCESLNSGACTEKTGLTLRIFLPVCDTNVINYCIESLGVSSIDGVLQSGSPIGYTNDRTYNADPNRGVPAAATTSRWKVANALNAAGTDTYAVKVLLDGYLTSTSKNLFIFKVSAIVEPYAETPSSITLYKHSAQCTSWQSDNACGVRKDFADGQRTRLSVRLPNTITGWLSGRLKGANIAIEPFDGLQNRLTVTAEHVKVPELDVEFTESEMNALADPSYFRPGGSKWQSTDAGNPAALNWLQQLTKPLKDTATGEHTTWAFSTIKNSGNNPCLTDTKSVVGVVMTNALAYAPGAPDFDGTQLNYRVGGLHFKSDGKTPNEGTYDLLMRSETARCLYNFTNAPISASISVTYAESGEQKIATTSLSEKDGWLHLGAYGFTFSSPTLRVKLSGIPKTIPKQDPTPSTQPQPQPQKNANANVQIPKTKSYTITCVKGKITRKITNSKPICPTGWKKK